MKMIFLWICWTISILIDNEVESSSIADLDIDIEWPYDNNITIIMKVVWNVSVVYR
jgi:hypothetical protein